MAEGPVGAHPPLRAESEVVGVGARRVGGEVQGAAAHPGARVVVAERDRVGACAQPLVAPEQGGLGALVGGEVALGPPPAPRLQRHDAQPRRGQPGEERGAARTGAHHHRVDRLVQRVPPTACGPRRRARRQVGGCRPRRGVQRVAVQAAVLARERRLPGRTGAETDGVPPAGVGHAGVAPLGLHVGVRGVCLDELREHLLEPPRRRQRLPGGARRVARAHGGEHGILRLGREGRERTAGARARRVVQAGETALVGVEVGRERVVAPAVAVAAGEAGVHRGGEREGGRVRRAGKQARRGGAQRRPFDRVERGGACPIVGRLGEPILQGRPRRGRHQVRVQQRAQGRAARRRRVRRRRRAPGSLLPIPVHTHPRVPAARDGWRDGPVSTSRAGPPHTAARRGCVGPPVPRHTAHLPYAAAGPDRA